MDDLSNDDWTIPHTDAAALAPPGDADDWTVPQQDQPSAAPPVAAIPAPTPAPITPPVAAATAPASELDDWAVPASEQPTTMNDAPVAGPDVFPTAAQPDDAPDTPISRIAGAVGKGMRQGFGDEGLGMSPEQENKLRGAVQGDRTGLLDAAVRFGVQPAAALADLAFQRLPGAIFGGLSGGVAQAGAEADKAIGDNPVGRFLDLGRLGRDAAALPEAFPFGHPGGVPHEAAPKFLGPLEPAPTSVGAWASMLGFPRTLAEAETNYRTLARTAHPDLGGSQEQMAWLNNAIGEARQAFSDQRAPRADAAATRAADTQPAQPTPTPDAPPPSGTPEATVDSSPQRSSVRDVDAKRNELTDILSDPRPVEWILAEQEAERRAQEQMAAAAAASQPAVPDQPIPMPPPAVASGAAVAPVADRPAQALTDPQEITPPASLEASNSTIPTLQELGPTAPAAPVPDQAAQASAHLEEQEQAASRERFEAERLARKAADEAAHPPSEPEQASIPVEANAQVPAENPSVPAVSTSSDPALPGSGYTYTPMDVSQPTWAKQFWHGTKAKVSRLSDADVWQFGDVGALYGQGLYLTDHPDVAQSYANTKGAGQTSTVLGARLKNLSLIDLEQPMPTAAHEAFANILKPYLTKREVASALAGPAKSAFGMLKEGMADEGLTRGDAMEVYDALTHNLSEAGFDGFRHEGGAFRGKQHGPHNVVILWEHDMVDREGKQAGRPLRGKFFDGEEHPGQAPATGAGTPSSPITVTHPSHMDQAGQRAATPTEAQAKAGNYSMGHVKIGGLDISIETPMGAERSGTDKDGTPWKATMGADYGYFKRTKGADGDHVDTYVGPEADKATRMPVYIYDQIASDENGRQHFDEHKVMLGFPTELAARTAYRASFSDGVDRVGSYKKMSWNSFRDWLRNGDTTQPVAWRPAGAPKPSRFVNPRRPESLTEYLARSGGIIDRGGNIQAMIGKPRSIIPGKGPLISSRGMNLDQALTKAREGGYISNHYDENNPEQIDINTLLDKIAEDLNGNRQYSDSDYYALAEWQAHKDSQEHQALVVKMRQNVREKLHELGETLTSQGVSWAAEAVARGEEMHQALYDAAMTEAAAFEHRLAGLAAERGDPQWAVPTWEQHMEMEDTREPAGEQPAEEGAVATQPDGRAEDGGDEAGADPGQVLEPARGEDQQQLPARAADDGAAPAARTERDGNTLLPGFSPVTDRERAQAGADRALTGGAAPLEDGLWDVAARGQSDLIDRVRSAELSDQNERRLSVAGQAELRGGTDAPREATPEQAQALVAAVQKIVGPNVEVDVKGADLSINFGGRMARINGSALGRLIEVATRTPEEMEDTLNHEAIHVLRNMGVLSPAEWRTLETAAVNKGWIDADFARNVQYPPEIRSEEAIAEAFKRYMRDGGAPAGLIGRAFAKMRRFFEAVGNALLGNGLRTSEGVFERIARGKVARRKPGSRDKQRGPETVAESRDRIAQSLVNAGLVDKALAKPAQDLLASISESRDKADARSQNLARRVGATLENVPALHAAAMIAATHLTDLAHSVQMSVTPMAHGKAPDEARAIAKDYANSVRLVRWTANRAIDDLGSRFTADALNRMWNAVDADYVSWKEGDRTAGNNMKALEPDERAETEKWLEVAKGVMGTAIKVGVANDADINPFYVPRIAAGMKQGEAGPVRVIRDFRTLPRAIGSVQEAILGRQLLNQVKVAAAASGQRVVRIEGDDDFELTPGDQPREITTPGGPGRPQEPLFGINQTSPHLRRRKHLTTEETEAAAQKVRDGRDEDGFKWVTFPNNTGLYERVFVGKDEDGKPLMAKRAIQVREDFAGPLRAVMRTPNHALYNVAMNLKGRMMTAIMYGWTHLNVIAARAFPYAANPRDGSVIGAMFEGKALRSDTRFMSRMIQNGLVPIGERGGFQDIEAQTGYKEIKPGRSLVAQAIAAPFRLISPAAANAILRGSDKMGHLTHGIMWKKIGDLQVGIAAREERELIHKGYSPKVAALTAAHNANRAVGSLPPESMSQLAQQIANFSLFSRSYRLGVAGTMKDMFNGFPRDVAAQIKRSGGAEELAKIRGRQRRHTAMVLAIDLMLKFGLTSTMANVADTYLLGNTVKHEISGYTDRFMRTMANVSESPGAALNILGLANDLTPMGDNEPTKQNRVLVGFEKDGTGIYMRNPFGKFAEDVTDYLTQPRQTLNAMMSPFMKLGMGMVLNKDSNNQPIYDPSASFMSPKMFGAIGDLAMFSLGNTTPSGPIGAVTRLATGESARPWFDVAQILGGSVGLSFSHGAKGGPVKGELQAAKNEHEFALQRVLPEVRDLVAKGRADEAARKLAGLGVGPGLIRWFIKQAVNPQATPEQMTKAWQFMTPEQRDRTLRQVRRQADMGSQSPP